jgi:hypothetical protein
MVGRDAEGCALAARRAARALTRRRFFVAQARLQ